MSRRKPEATPGVLPRVAAIPVRFSDGVVTAIRERLCAVPPERGGALLAVGSLIHLLVEDTSGRYSGASWDISAELSTTVGLLETARHGRLIGTVHTHPYAAPDPSGTDVRSTGRMLDINPHLHELTIAVVTRGPLRPADLDLGSGYRMSLHTLRRGKDGDHVLRRVEGRTVPLTADLRTTDVDLPSATAVRDWVGKRARARERDDLPQIINVNHRPRLVLPVPSDHTAALLVDGEYPLVGPLAVRWERDAGGRPAMAALPSPWDPGSAAAGQLAALARTAAGRRTGEAVERVWPLLGDLTERRVVVAGLGSVGSRIAEDLVRCGVGTLTVIDPECVEGPNLARSVYTSADLGVAKPTAMARRLRAIDPAVRVEEHVAALGDLDLAGLLSGADLVVGATDDMAEQARLSHHAYAAGIPMVSCALYRRAAAGEVVISVPATETACWNCAVGARSTATDYRPARDYGLNGRLVGEAALGPAINIVSSCAAAVAVGLLAGPSTPAGEHLVGLLRDRRTLGIVSTSPRWEFFPQVIAPEPHQHAPQSIWAVIRRDPRCPICGDPEHRVPPSTDARGDELASIIAGLKQAAQDSTQDGAERTE
ncbi:hypothetical protein GCM10029978_112790 [Actinoallomurus acanthiterrae]